MYKLLLTLVFSSLLQAAIYNGVAIIVKDQAITLFEIQEKMHTLHIDAKRASDMLIRQKLEAIEIKEKGIHVENAEVYDEIAKTASRNKLTVSEFYEAVRNSSGLSSTQLKDKIKQRLLTQKLYMSIAYSAVSEPSQEEMHEYYDLHKAELQHPTAFDVVIYQSFNKKKLQEKIDNPMFYSPEIKRSEQTLKYNAISPELAKLLEKTPLNHFSPALPDGKKQYVSFYVKSITSAAKSSFDDLKEEIKNRMMQAQRESVLTDYFARLRQNVLINTLRMPN